MIFIYLLSGLFLGWSFGAKDTANIFGSAVETRMLKFKTAALIAAVFVTLGAVFDGGGPSGTLSKLGSINEIGGAFTVALAAAATITIMVRIGIPVATTQTLAGAIIGWNYFSGKVTDFRSLAAIASSWLLAPLLGAIFAAILYFIFRYYSNRVKVHLLEQDFWTRTWLLIIGAFGAYSLGANNIANIVGVFVPVNPFNDLTVPGFGVVSGVTLLFLLGSLSIVVGIYTYSHKVMKTVGRELFGLSPLTGLIAVLAESLVLFLFSSKGLHDLLVSLHLPPIPLVPVSASQIIVGSVLGIGLAKGGKNIRYSVLGKISLGWVTAPLLAFIFSFVALFIVQNVFEQKVNRTLTYSFNRESMTEMKRQGIDLGPLAVVNGRDYESEMQLHRELAQTQSYAPLEIMHIIRTAEVDNITIRSELLEKKHLRGKFNAQQLEAVKALEGKTFMHKWQLLHALEKDISWRMIPDPANDKAKQHNSRILSAFDLLTRTFSRPVKQ